MYGEIMKLRRTLCLDGKRHGCKAPFGGPKGAEDTVADDDDATAQNSMDDFGTTIIELAGAIWKIQSNALISKGIATP